MAHSVDYPTAADSHYNTHVLVDYNSNSKIRAASVALSNCIVSRNLSVRFATLVEQVPAVPVAVVVVFAAVADFDGDDSHAVGVVLTYALVHSTTYDSYLFLNRHVFDSCSFGIVNCHR